MLLVGWKLVVAANCCCWLLILVAAVDCCCWLLLLVAAAGCCCWLLLLVAAAGCCCWLLLLVAAVDCCCWLLLLIAAAGCCCWLLLLIAAAGCCCWLLLLIAAQKVFEYFRILVGDLRLRQFSGEKVFEYFRFVDDLRLRQIRRRKSLWIFSVCWWFAAKTNSQAKKSLNFFGSWWKVFEYFQNIDEGEKWKKGSPRGSRLESEWILWLCAGYLYSIFQDGRRLSESQ